jgi:hypothetical protein
MSGLSVTPSTLASQERAMTDGMDKREIPERVPDVSEVTGAYFEPIHSIVSLQYKSGDRLLEIRFPLEQIMKSEDWFIQIRKHVGDASRDRKDRR